MTSLSRALVAEHEAFAKQVDELRRLAEDCGEERPGPVIHEVDASLHFLEHDLLPHAAAEDAVLYPAVALLLGRRRSRRASRRLTRDRRRSRC